MDALTVLSIWDITDSDTEQNWKYRNSDPTLSACPSNKCAFYCYGMNTGCVFCKLSCRVLLTLDLRWSMVFSLTVFCHKIKTIVTKFQNEPPTLDYFFVAKTRRKSPIQIWLGKCIKDTSRAE